MSHAVCRVLCLWCISPNDNADEHHQTSPDEFGAVHWCRRIRGSLLRLQGGGTQPTCFVRSGGQQSDCFGLQGAADFMHDSMLEQETAVHVVVLQAYGMMYNVQASVLSAAVHCVLVWCKHTVLHKLQGRHNSALHNQVADVPKSVSGGFLAC